MPSQLILIISASCYLLAAWRLWKNISQRNIGAGDGSATDNSAIKDNSNDRTVFVLAALGIVTHCAYIVFSADSNSQSYTLNLNLSTMTGVVSLVVVSTFLLGCTRLQISRLGVLVYPLTVISLLFSSLWSSDSPAISEQALLPISAFSLHIIGSLLAYALLAIAAVQALLYLYQEKQIKNRSAPAMLLLLPPLQTMEQLLFRLSLIGFGLLSFTLVSGALFSQQIFGQAFAFKHHTLFALTAWLVLAIMLYKHFKEGLRGSQTAPWVLVSFILVQVGYFGTKIITETLNLN